MLTHQRADLELSRMGRKKKGDVSSATTQKKPVRDGRNFNFWADPDLSQALESYRSSLLEKGQPEGEYTKHLELALKEYLNKRGFWPPQK